MTRKLTAISLFSSAGIGELGMHSSGLEILAANELLADRCALYATNYPHTRLFTGNIWNLKSQLVEYVRSRLDDGELFVAYATPPCQGMSTNGVGKLMAEIEAGTRQQEDERNRLIIPAMDVICELRPRWVLLENVPGMQSTVIRTEQGHQQILRYIADRLGPDYTGKAEVISCADFGVPQLRRRLITIYTRDDSAKKYFAEHGTFLPKSGTPGPRTLRDAIASLPPLDASAGKSSATWFHPHHFVGVMKPEKYWWISHTPEGETAYNNQCVNTTCLYTGNARHSDELQEGRWRSKKSIPIYCARCGSLLPRPNIQVAATGERRLIRGFHSAYRRMEWDKPARALTSNFPFEASDNKVHPEQNRVLSIYEATVIQTIDRYAYSWVANNVPATKTLIAHAIGESVPPALIERIVQTMISVSRFHG
jgi:DNA (cytosine-5)-methyltransferase 1